MKLTYFSIQDYRSIKKAEFSDLSNVAILIGPNNEGKSNVLQGLHSCLTTLSGSAVLFRREGTDTTVRLRYDVGTYDWDQDYPVAKQHKDPDGTSIFELNFLLSELEQARFQGQTGSRPIELKFDPSRYASFKVLKQGRGGAALSRKAEAISKFVSENLDYVYVPAIRTAETSTSLVNELVTQQLRQLEDNPQYVEIQKKIIELQQTILDSIVAKLKANLHEFLGPSFKDITITLSARSRLRALARSAQMIIDDGTPTTLERKGDGVKSSRGY